MVAHRPQRQRATDGPPPRCPAGVVATTDVEVACQDVDVAVMIGGFPRKAGMERKDVMAKNVSIYKNQASALEKGASKDVKVRPRGSAGARLALAEW
jgi:malate dehydrogenase